MWYGEKFMFIELNKKPPNNIWETVSVHNKHIINPYLTKDNLTLLDRYR